MSTITTHVLDISTGKPAKDVQVKLLVFHLDVWDPLEVHHTNSDGRITGMADVPSGIYKLQFHTQEYYNKLSVQSFYPLVEITFQIASEAHYHVPLLLSPHGYSTYRGS
jgi:5-hydroxyisourate hydrolase